MKKVIVAIDGPAGAGKSTIARAVAKSLKYLYIDTGAMYRAVAWKAIQKGLSFDADGPLIEMARNMRIRLCVNKKKGGLEVFADGKNITKEIRTENVSRGSNLVAGVAEIRSILVDQQRKMGEAGNVVMEGRDIGTVVFPRAQFKFYLDASEKERVKRRYRELKSKGKKVRLKEIEQSLKQRDERDQNRSVSPLAIAPDARAIDSTRLTADEAAKIMIDQVKRGLNP